MINQKTWIDTDPFIDIDALRSLDYPVIRGICLAPLKDIVIYGPHMLNQRSHFNLIEDTLKTPGPERDLLRTIQLSKSSVHKHESERLFTALVKGSCSGGFSIPLRGAPDYRLKNFANFTNDLTANSIYFPELMHFVYTNLPFSEIGRVLVFVNYNGSGTPIHTDDRTESHRNEFLWLRTNLKKQFFVYDYASAAKDYITSHSAFFNEQDWHGSDPCDHMCFSIRVDGVFTESFREQLGLSGITNYNTVQQD